MEHAARYIIFPFDSNITVATGICVKFRISGVGHDINTKHYNPFLLKKV